MTYGSNENAVARCTHCDVYIYDLSRESFTGKAGGLHHTYCGRYLKLQPHPSDIKDKSRREKARMKL
jgi:hypothetical protein